MRASRLIVPILVGALAIASAYAELQSSTILTEVQKRGVKAVVRELYDNKESWSALLKAVASGAPDWLEVAEQLRPGTDAGASEMLEIAVFHALAVLPRRALEMIAPGSISTSNHFSIEGVCSSNFVIDYGPDPSALNLIDQRIAALRAVNDVTLVAARDLSISGLEQARLDALRMIGESK